MRIRERPPPSGLMIDDTAARLTADNDSNYCNNMKPVELKVTRIGNSRGVRLPAGTLERYRVGDVLVMEERSDGILLRRVGNATPKLSWEQTAAEMAASDERWEEWD